ELIDNFNKQIANEADFNSWVTSVISENESIKIDSATGTKEILTLFQSWKVTKLLPIKISSMLELSPNVVNIFFAIQQVIDKTIFEEILRNRNVDIKKFKVEYGSAVFN